MGALIRQYVVPWLVLRRTRRSHLVIPFLTGLKDRIDVDNNTTIVEHAVMDELSNPKFGIVNVHKYILRLRAGIRIPNRCDHIKHDCISMATFGR